ncbi:hypothetical protein SAMN02910384_02918 [Pseudobutyrivibrio sp. ACV-2]|uniref:hypothetical protein n=1 Tax=Pseudobutyrivibrio sp. ACV-2 TaxID=1520801 RepID=UPI00089C4FA4|nr:hypothetical protein [Pseudobutyrivibrio sp. ACV-2]SEA97708.1 hypothetical protein SAMN02910384_02918 [Pseudobutyrivibrio sp. ACV-2]
MRLQFYKKGIPTKILQRAAILLAVFIISLVFFEIVTNISEDVEISKQSSPTLPIVTMEFLNHGNTQLHGYTSEMDPAYMRDAIIPLDKKRTISLSIDTKDFPVDSLSYEIRSLDTQRNIAKNDLDYKKDGDIITASFQAENLIEVNEEYLLILTLENDGKSVYYYTRIMETDGCNETEILDFAQYFHNTALSEDATDLATYIEPKSTGNDQDLGHVNINSTLSQISYGNSKPTQVGTTNVAMTDITSNYISLTLLYTLSMENDDHTEYYTASEDFRIRYTADRIYLLSYDRTMEQLLDKDSIQITDNLINIGITDPDVKYLSNETGTIVSFVENGSLFQYDQTNRQIKEIFSFVDDPTDCRSTYNQHQILLLNIDESGSMDFVVYGYMNSGTHEGQSGINLYHYDATEDVASEQLFITSTSSYQILNANFSDLLYEASDGEFYIMINGTLVYMNLKDLTTKEVITGLDDAQYASSSSRRYVAWMEDANVSESIHIMDLETNQTFDIEAEEGQLLKPLSFMDDDIIYGSIYEKDIIRDQAGSMVYPMYALTIADITSGKAEPLKTYQKNGYYITGVHHDSYTIYLDRVKIDSDGTILPADEDTIKNSAGAQNQAVPITTDIDEVKQQVVILNMTPLDEDETLGKVSYKVSGLVLGDPSRTIDVASTTSSTHYFVYVGSTVTLATDNLMEAITEADANMGVVLDNDPKYVWKRGRRNYQNPIEQVAYGSSDSEASSNAKALSAMLVHEGENVQVHTLLEAGETPISLLTKTLKDYTILDLTGATLDEALYYVSIGNPVYAYTGENNAVLIIGYDSTTITYFDPDTSTNKKMSMTEATDYFSTFGNVFVSYIK